jgi:hypothetical protein
MKLRVSLLITILLAITSITAISFAQRPQTEKPITGDFKIMIKQSMSGQEMTSTTMIKGLRERSETNVPGMPAGMGMTTITECDLKRTIQINDRSRKYLITPMDSGDTDTTSAPSGPRPSAGPSRRGGIVTMTSNTVDTGERRDMFGFTARHLKSTTMTESSPDACNPNNMKIERDGWYINLEYGLNCGSERPPQAPNMPTGGCRDTYRVKRTGVATLGYPLVETMKMYGADGSVTFTMTKEVIELSRQSLDAALFDIPAGYTQASSSQEMYSMSMGDAMAMSQQQEGGNSASNRPSNMPLASNTTSTAAARPKVGIVEFNNKAKASISTDELRQQLIATLSGDGIDAVALNASSVSEAAMEAKAKGCTYILYTDISTFKAPSAGKKIGGMLGGAVGMGGGGSGKAEAKFDFRLVPAEGGSPKLQSSASAKEDTSEASANAALQEEARAVAAAIGR